MDPAEYSLIGYIIDGQYYFDKVLPMGMCTAPYITQRITDSITYLHRKMEFFLLNYVDDFVSAELKDVIWRSYNYLTELLDKLHIETSPEKRIPPTTRLEFLGITFDTIKMTMEISQEKLAEIKNKLDGWMFRTKARRREVESLIGKLQFLAKCIKAGRIFLSRLINLIKEMDRVHKYNINLEAKRDIAW